MLWGDSKSQWDSSVLTDKRVSQYWDSQRQAGLWFARKVNHREGISWDAFFVFGPDARWTDAPKPLTAYGSPIIRHAEALRQYL